MAGQVAPLWLQRADAAHAAVIGVAVLLLHWERFRDEVGVAAPDGLVTVAAVAAVAWAAVLWMAAPSRAGALVTAAAAAGTAIALLGASATKTLGDVAIVVVVLQTALSAVTEAAIAAFAIRSNRTRTRS